MEFFVAYYFFGVFLLLATNVELTIGNLLLFLIFAMYAPLVLLWTTVTNALYKINPDKVILKGKTNRDE